MSIQPTKRRPKLRPALKPYVEGNYKWAVYYRGENGSRARRKFEMKKDAVDFLEDKRVESENLGNRIASALGDNLKREAFDALELLRPYGKTIVDAAKFYHAHLVATAKSETLGQAYDEFLVAMAKAGKSPTYLAELRVRVNSFIRSQSTRMCAEVSTREVAQWLQALKVSNVTRNNYRRVLCSYFSWCTKMGYCPDNPVTKVGRSKDESNEIGIYSPIEMATILRAAKTWSPETDRPRKRHRLGNESRDILANMAICAFAGLRQAEFERLSWEQIKFDRNIIDLSAAITKTAARRVVKIRSVLRAWLEEIGPFGRGRICQPHFSTRIRLFRHHLAKIHKISWKHNALRHSFASYLMEEVQNPGEVSLQLGHGNAGVVFAHYRELVTPEDAQTFWGLTPSVVLSEGAEVIPLKRTADQ